MILFERLFTRVTSSVILSAAGLIFVSCHNDSSPKNDRKMEGLSGPVKTIRTETSKLLKQADQYLEGPREVAKTATFNSKGYVVEEAYSTAEGALLYKVIYTYDGNKKSEAVLHDPKGMTRDKRVFSYDAKGNLVEQSNYRVDGSLQSRWLYEYDDRKNQTEWAAYNPKNARVDKWTYSYDEKGNKKEEARYFSDQSVDAKYVHTFDDKGNRIETAKYDAKDELVEKARYAYEFDSNGNWIKKTTLKRISGNEESDFEPAEVTFRAIIYY